MKEQQEKPRDSTNRTERLDAVIAEYLEAVGKGRAPSPRAVVERHPDLAPELGEFFRDRECLKRLDSLTGDRSAVRDIVTASTLPRGCVFGDYRIDERVASGGMGVVYRAFHIRSHREVALKVIHSGELGSDERVRRFRLEAETAVGLDHPNIVPVYDAGEKHGFFYISMKLVEGGNLAQHLDGLRRNPREAARLVETVARAVDYAHERGVVHRDLKPGNILLEQSGRPYITDFGLAKRLELDMSITRSGTAVGTPRYMAPEQAAGGGRSGLAAADVYSLGVILYEIIARRPPFDGASAVEVLRQVLHGDLVPPSHWEPRVSRDLETICLKCLQKRPERRYPSAGELAEDLERFRRRVPINAHPPGPAVSVSRWVRRRPVVSGVLALALFSLAVVAGTRLPYDRSLEIAAHEVTAATRDRDTLFNRQAYAGTLKNAYENLGNGNVQRAKELLRSLRPRPGEPDLRSFGWYHLHRRIHRHERRHERRKAPARPRSRRVVLAVADARSGLVLGLRPDGGVTRLGLGGSVRPEDRRRAFGSAGTDPSRAAFATTDGAVEVWRLDWSREPPAAGLECSFRPSSGPVIRLAFSPEGERIAAADARGTVTVCRSDPRRASSPWTVERRFPTPGVPERVAFSLDGRFLAVSARARGTVFLCDIDYGDALPVAGENRERASALAFSDDRLLAIGRADGSVDFREAGRVEGRLRCVPRGGSRSLHAAAIDALVFSPDGKLFVSAGSDGRIRLWDLVLSERDQVALLRAELESFPGLRKLRFTKNRGTLVGTGRRGDGPTTVKRWTASFPGSPVARRSKGPRRVGGGAVVGERRRPVQ